MKTKIEKMIANAPLVRRVFFTDKCKHCGRLSRTAERKARAFATALEAAGYSYEGAVPLPEGCYSKRIRSISDEPVAWEIVWLEKGRGVNARAFYAKGDAS